MPRHVTEFVAEVCPRLSAVLRFDITDASVGETISVLLEPRFVPDPLGTPFPAGSAICISPAS